MEVLVLSLVAFAGMALAQGPTTNATTITTSTATANATTSSSPSTPASSNTTTGTCVASTFTGYESGLPSPYVVCSCNGFEAQLSTTTVEGTPYTVCSDAPEITVSVPAASTMAPAITTFGRKIAALRPEVAPSSPASQAASLNGPKSTGAAATLEKKVGLGGFMAALAVL
ncbi:Hypothetical predicted protein [Lecanosticta acicola]|uniref:Uncharacterized protein n=1 Tax=Lecanosticta acicola TaxID=111012 RepID=A0AAI9EF28_9PEZI|nr:Hypothetical predicted protein [Lecanosticta acicola]